MTNLIEVNLRSETWHNVKRLTQRPKKRHILSHLHSNFYLTWHIMLRVDANFLTRTNFFVMTPPNNSPLWCAVQDKDAKTNLTSQVFAKYATFEENMAQSKNFLQFTFAAIVCLLTHHLPWKQLCRTLTLIQSFIFVLPHNVEFFHLNFGRFYWNPDSF